jgi:hypothetical protein
MRQEDALYRIKKGTSGSSAKIRPDSPTTRMRVHGIRHFYYTRFWHFFQGKNTLKYYPSCISQYFFKEVQECE